VLGTTTRKQTHQNKITKHHVLDTTTRKEAVVWDWQKMWRGYSGLWDPYPSPLDNYIFNNITDR